MYAIFVNHFLRFRTTVCVNVDLIHIQFPAVATYVMKMAPIYIYMCVCSENIAGHTICPDIL